MLLTLILPILALIVTSHCETTENEVTELEETTEVNSTIPPILDATASKLVRYRSKPPPMSYYRHKTRPNKPPRPRIKIQKYGPQPSRYNIPEPKSYYKHQPEIYSSTLSYKPTYSYDEVHYEVSSEYPAVETHIPAVSYETQAMDLDFYSDSYSKKKAPQYEYPKPQKPYNPQRPHKTYGLPKEQSYNSYDSYSGGDYKTQYPPKHEVQYEVSYHEESPKQSYGPPPSQHKEEYEQFPPYGTPPKGEDHVSYQPPDNKYEAPVSSYHPQEQSNEGPYPVYEKKLPNVGYSYNKHFAEPPTDIHYTYSPSYDINPLPPKHGPPQNTYGAPPRNNYGPPSDSYGPPSYNQNSHSDYHAPSDSYHQSSGGNFAEPPGSYLPPVHHPDDLPLKKNHMPPGYDYPKSSYEVPLYDPIPFQSTTPDQDYFPPNHHAGEPHYEHAAESTTHIQHIPPQGHQPNKPPSSTITTTVSAGHEPIQEANNKVHRFAPHNYRSNHITRHESTSSKFPNEATSSEAPTSKYLDKILSTTTTFRTRRKRKRTKAPVTEKHILDAPELKEAFDSGHDQSEELAAHSSNIKENIDIGRPNIQSVPPLQTSTDFSSSHSWNPMRIRTKQLIPQRGQRIAETALSELKNIEVLSIEKSHSHSYYAGTVPPQRTRNLGSRADTVQMGTVPATTFKAEDAIQPTRSLVIDKTYFKVKDNEDDFYDGTGELPKNHKLF